MAQYAYNPITNRLDLTNASSPGGDVIGPGSSTDNALVRWDGVTGTMIQNSNAILSDAGLLSLALALPATSGGTAQTTYTTGDTLYASAANTLSKLAVGSNGQVLTLAAGIPSWATPTTGTVTSVSGTADRITSTGGATPVIDIAATYVGQASITTLGTIATGVWNGSVIPLAYGGTNANLTASNGGVFYSTATAGAILSGTATARQMLQSGASGAPAWSTATYPATTTANQLLYSSATNVVNEITGANNGVLITSNAGVPSLLAAGTTGQVLTATTGAPAAWATPAIGSCMFSASLSAGGLTDSTGDGTVVTLGSGTALTELYDVGSNFNTNGTFTAPATGYYHFDYAILSQQVAATMSCNSTLTVSGTSANAYLDNDFGTCATGNMQISASRNIFMTATDTAVVTYQYSGGTKTVDTYGGGGFRTYFSGFRIA